MTTPTPSPKAGRLFHRPVATGRGYWGPGDHYARFAEAAPRYGMEFV